MTTSSPPTPADGITLLVVDDDASMRQLVRMLLLRERGDAAVDVVEARDGREAIDLARDAAPDAIVLDLAMPGMDGLTALPILRQEAPSARIVVFSAGADREADVLAAGADLWLGKDQWQELPQRVFDMALPG